MVSAFIVAGDRSLDQKEDIIEEVVLASSGGRVWVLNQSVPTLEQSYVSGIQRR